MANNILTIEMITLECLRVLVNNLTLTGNVNRQFDKMFAVTGAKIGDTCYVRVPPRYVIRKGNAMVPQDTQQNRVPVQLTELAGVDLPFSSVERTLSLDDASNSVIKPVMATIANQIDLDGFLTCYPEVYQAVGTPGTVPTLNSTYLAAGVKLDNMAAPPDDQRFVEITPDMMATIVNANLALFNPQQVIATAVRKGLFGQGVLGLDWYKDQNAPTHTIGTYAAVNGTPTVTGAGQTGSNIITGGWVAGDALNRGDIVQFSGVQSINPQSRLATGQVAQFRVTQNCVADGGGAMTIPIYPPITLAPVKDQTVSGSPAAGATVTVHGASGTVHRIGLAHHRDAFTLATAPLEMVYGVHECYMASDDQTGIATRVISQYEIGTNQMYTRFDTLYGWAVLRPELAIRVSS